MYKKSTLHLLKITLLSVEKKKSTKKNKTILMDSLFYFCNIQ
jgi:hypothetical protein